MFCELMHVPLEFGEPTGCPLAWSLPSLHGWRKDWCLRKAQPGRLRWLLAKQQQRCSGNANRSWNLGRFLELIAGRAIFGWAVPWISGIFGFHEEPLYQVCNDGRAIFEEGQFPDEPPVLFPTCLLSSCHSCSEVEEFEISLEIKSCLYLLPKKIAYRIYTQNSYIAPL